MVQRLLNHFFSCFQSNNSNNIIIPYNNIAHAANGNTNIAKNTNINVIGNNTMIVTTNANTIFNTSHIMILF